MTEYTPSDNPDATPLRTISGLALPDGVDVDAKGNIYVANGLAGVERVRPRRDWRRHPIGNDLWPSHRHLRTKRRGGRAPAGHPHTQARRGAREPLLPRPAARKSRHDAVPVER